MCRNTNILYHSQLAHDDDEEQNLKTKVINDEVPFKKVQDENGDVSSDTDGGEDDRKKLVKKKRYKKKVKKPQKTDSYAFVEMAGKLLH